MSVNVLVVPEDPARDQYILRPLFRAMLTSAGAAAARVEVCTDPRVRGIADALSWSRIEEILDLYHMVHLFLLAVDRDGDAARPSRLRALEGRAAERLAERGSPHGRSPPALFAVAAREEIEVWALAAMDDLPGDWRWSDVRRARRPKERYFAPYARRRGLHRAPHGGRQILGDEAGRRYSRVRGRCKEVRDLEDRVARWLRARR